MFTNSSISQTLKPLVLFCQSDNPLLAKQAVDFALPKLLAKPEIALSYSAQQQGWLYSLAKNYRVLLEGDLDNLLLKLDIYDLLLINPLSLNSLAKFSLGIQDSLPSIIFAEFAKTGKPILISDASLPTDDSTLNPHLFKTYKNHWQNIISGTITSYNHDNLEERICKIIRSRAIQAQQRPLLNSKVFITKDDIIAAADTLEPLKVPYGSIITDVAKEEAIARNISIIFE